MKQNWIIILILFAIYSCNNSSKNKNKQTKSLNTKELNKESLTKKITQTENIDTIKNIGLPEALAKAAECFPNDSASLYRFYFKRNSTTEQKKIDKQIIQLETLTTKELVDRYKEVEKYLKPLLTEIVKSNNINKIQCNSLVKLYSDFDYFSGESLFSQLLTNEDYDNLVYKSFRIMAKERTRDTCFISAFIKLENNIRTNAELSEAMRVFVVQSIRNNPTGFLEMYNFRNAEKRSDFAKYIVVWDEPDKDLIEKFTEISNNSVDEKYKILATELLEKLKE